MKAGRIAVLSIIVLLLITLPASLFASADDAWQALHELDIPQAIELFEAARAEDSSDHSLIRGLILAHHFNGYRDPQIELMREALSRDPGNPYNNALFEHFSSEFEDHALHYPVTREFAEAFMALPPGPLQFNGHKIFDSYATGSLSETPDDWHAKTGTPPAVWISGPFENNSKVAAVRNLPGETEPLDTTMQVDGKDGTKVTWMRLEPTRLGDLISRKTMLNTFFSAVQMRCPFRLERDQEVTIIVGGAMHHRVRIDGKVIGEDRLVRNAVVRDGFRIRLEKGEHEITLVCGWQEAITPFSIHLLDSAYEPIDGLTWLRTADPVGISADSAVRVHPIFDAFEEYVAENGDAPDTRFWRAILLMYNARSSEAVEVLEAAEAAKDLSALERYALYLALSTNGEGERASIQMQTLANSVSAALIDVLWVLVSQSDYAQLIRQMNELSTTYPDRPHIDMFVALQPLLTGNVAGFFAAVDSFKQEYPQQLMIYPVVMGVQQNSLGDYQATLNEFLEYCRKGQRNRNRLMEGPGYYLQAGKLEEAYDCARRALDSLFGDDTSVESYGSAAVESSHIPEAIEVIDSLIALQSNNIELWSWKYLLHSRNNQYAEAQSALKEIHFLKPTATLPYKQIDSLHNNASYDSIFTPIDIMSLWGDDPAEEQLNGQNQYTLLDSRQVVLFESGTAVNDIHTAWVLLDRSSVETYQETSIGFYPNSDWADLLVAHRLRKGQPPLAGVHEGSSIYFEDLQPGDCIEVRYRSWEQTGGDLWRHYWHEYQAGSNNFQRMWQYVVMTNRDDLRFASTYDGVEAEVDTHFDFTRTTWRQENAPAIDDSPTLSPPWDDIMGQVISSTMPDWDVLANWYADISEAVLDDNPRAKQLAREIIDDGDNEMTILRKLYENVIFNINYQVMDFNYSASIPHIPDNVLISRWGDCKDKSHLLMAMLREHGIDCWPILVMTRREGTEMPLPYFGHNHLITGCVIDGDTLFVDPTDSPYPPEHSIRYDVAGQPCLHVLPGGKSYTDVVPGIAAEDVWQTWTLTLEPDDAQGQYRFIVDRQFANQLAGDRRDYYRDESYTELRKRRESYYVDNWGTPMTVDTVIMDSVFTTDSVFTDQFSGSMTLSTQKLGGSTIIQLPDWAPFRSSRLTDLYGHGERQYPVDTRNLLGAYTYVLKLRIPEGYQEPQLSDAVSVEEDKLYFAYDYTYDADARELVLTYDIRIEDGLVPVETFHSYLSKVLEMFDTSILLNQES